MDVCDRKMRLCGQKIHVVFHCFQYIISVENEVNIYPEASVAEISVQKSWSDRTVQILIKS